MFGEQVSDYQIWRSHTNSDEPSRAFRVVSSQTSNMQHTWRYRKHIGIICLQKICKLCPQRLRKFTLTL